ncbi:hypothetical protein BDV37DRAFT_242369 [Aspergillus pseudonomiae]|uniref:Uncharacterized protein n=1 Tax=Aspergillus pseudonomiae TaxID=1506151 RepID=A0A5N7DL06_9EURO|nr:uncharacterized protein BDV37DRAFT_242369 [Aspergillus pseudonomiae]KAE8406663.1 hypothetical protein BDV37DRAFT_242369 [Aspergillus pseudonomiae]
MSFSPAFLGKIHTLLAIRSQGYSRPKIASCTVIGNDFLSVPQSISAVPAKVEPKRRHDLQSKRRVHPITMVSPSGLKQTSMIQNLRKARIQKWWWCPIASQSFTWRRADTALMASTAKGYARTFHDQRPPPECEDIKPLFSPWIPCYPRQRGYLLTVGFAHSKEKETRRIRRAVPAKASVFTTRIGSALGRCKRF